MILFRYLQKYLEGKHILRSSNLYWYELLSILICYLIAIVYIDDILALISLYILLSFQALRLFILVTLGSIINRLRLAYQQTPNGGPCSFLSLFDFWRCRYRAASSAPMPAFRFEYSLMKAERGRRYDEIIARRNISFIICAHGYFR